MIENLKYINVNDDLLNTIAEENENEVWADLVPGRRDFAQEIVDYLDKEFQKKKINNTKGTIEDFYDDEGKSTVLAIDAEYGMGKTRFAKALNLHIENSIYLSVWEKDYIENPLISITKELAKYQKEHFKQNLAKAVFGVAKCFNIGIPGVASFDLSKFANEFLSDNDEMKALRDSLEKIIEEKGHTVIIIDELDRCRPDYAVKVLETIKHFFDIPGLSFVLPINKNFLEKSIEGFYNLDKETFAEKEHYLNRFFTDSLTLEKIDLIDYIESQNSKFKNFIDYSYMSIWNKNAQKISLRQVNNAILFMTENEIKYLPIWDKLKDFYKSIEKDNNTGKLLVINNLNNKLKEEQYKLYKDSGLDFNIISKLYNALRDNSNGEKILNNQNYLSKIEFEELTDNIKKDFHYSSKESVENYILKEVSRKYSNLGPSELRIISSTIRIFINLAASPCYDEVTTSFNIKLLKR